MADFSINWSAQYTGPANETVQGFVVCPNSTNTGYVRATAANRAIAGRISGVARTERDSRPPNQFVMQYNGEVEPALTGLGPGAAQPVIVDANGRMARTASVAPNDVYVGQAGPDGGVSLGFGGSAVSAGGSETLNGRRVERAIDIRDFGGVGDASWDSNNLLFGTDNTAAWNAWMSAAAAESPAGKQLLSLPRGMFYCAGDLLNGVNVLQIPTSVHLIGKVGAGINGTGGQGNSGIVLPPFTNLTFCNNGTSVSGTGDARHSEVEHINIHTVTPIISNPSWQATYSMLGPGYTRQAYISAGKPVPKGACVVKNNATVSATGLSKTDASGTNNTVMFRALSSFTPSGSDPARFGNATTANLGETVSDGAGSWLIESVPKDRGLFSASAAIVGQQFTVPGDPRYIFKVIGAGTLAHDNSDNCGASTTGWKGTLSPYIQAAPYMTFTDGSATMRTFPSGVIMMHANECKLHDITLMGGFGYAVQVEGGSLDNIAFGSGAMWAVADYPHIERLRVFYAGGLHVHGAENNVGTFRDIVVDAPGEVQRSVSSLMGEGQACVWIRQQGKVQVEKCYYASGNSAGFVADSSAGAAAPGMPDLTQTVGFIEFLDCNAEGNLSYQLLLGENALWLGTGSQQTHSEVSQAMILGQDRCRRIVGTETASGKKVNYELQKVFGSSVASYGIAAGQDITKSQRVSWYVDKVNTSTVGTGHICLARGPNQGSLSKPRVGFRITYGDAKNTGSGPGPGIALITLEDGYFNTDVDGNTAGIYYGTHVGMLEDTRLRYGKRLVGDSFPYPGATYAAGTYARCRVTVAGYNAPKWTAGLVYKLEDDAAYQEEATVVRPSTSPDLPDGAGRIWMYTGTLTNNGVEPIWPASGNFTDAHGNTWVDMGARCTAVRECLIG